MPAGIYEPADQRIGAGHGALYLGGEPRPAEPDAAGAVSDPSGRQAPHRLRHRLHGGPPAADGGQSRHRPKAVPAGHAGADSHRLHLPPPPHLHRRRGGAYPAPAPSGAVPYPADLGDAAAEQRDSGAPASGLGRAAGGAAGPAHLPPHHRQPAGGEPPAGKGRGPHLPAVPHAGRLPPHMGGHPALFLPSGRPYRSGGGAGHGHRLLRHGPAHPQRRRSRHRGGADPEPTGADL